MYRSALAQQVIEMLTPFLQDQGYELVELQLQQRQGRWLVRIFADTDEGISLEDCRRLSLEIGYLLDAEDVIPAAYILEVSSPGLDRPLKTKRDFQRQMQRLVTIFLNVPVTEKTQYTGRVTAVSDLDVVLHLSPDELLTIPLSSINHGIIELEFK